MDITDCSRRWLEGRSPSERQNESVDHAFCSNLSRWHGASVESDSPWVLCQCSRRNQSTVFVTAVFAAKSHARWLSIIVAQGPIYESSTMLLEKEASYVRYYHPEVLPLARGSAAPVKLFPSAVRATMCETESELSSLTL